MAISRKSERNDDYADPYEEEFEEVDPDDTSVGSFRHWTYDIVYRSSHSDVPQTVRAVNATEPIDSRADQYPDGCVTFHDDGEEYAYIPDERRLLSVGHDQQNVTLAAGDDILRIEQVQYPPGAPLIGAEQTDVVATVHHRSDRTGSLTSFDMEVDREESSFWRLTGHRVSDDARVDVKTRKERDVIVKHYGRTGTLHLGKTARVEFPLGHSYSVDIHGLPDDKAGEYVERIEEAIESSYRYDEIEADVTHDGRIE